MPAGTVMRRALFLSESAALLAGCDLTECASVQIGVVDIASDFRVWCDGEAEDADLRGRARLGLRRGRGRVRAVDRE
eukprot:8037804-Alexandrium_andersonii.AAC.2